MTLSEAVADELSAKFAEAHWVKFKDAKLFCETPVYTRGVPHGLIPGIHACCDYMVDGLETLRESNLRSESTTVDVIASLPFSPWTQAIAPTIEATAALSIRLCVRDPSLLSTSSGKAYLPDSTAPARAIVRPPLLDGPVQVSIADNPFGTSYEHIDSFFNCANTLALFSRQLTTIIKTDSGHELSKTKVLHEVISRWVFGRASGQSTAPSELGRHECLVVADALVVLSAMYPSNWKVAESCIHDTWASALPALASMLSRETQACCDPQDSKRTEESSPHYLDDLGLSADQVAAGRRWWCAFCRLDKRLCAWENGVGKLVDHLEQHDGTYRVSNLKCVDMRLDLERAVRAAYLVHSEDGVASPPEPCPAARAKSMDHVKRPHVDPTFVGDAARSVDAKGCLVGRKPHPLRRPPKA